RKSALQHLTRCRSGSESCDLQQHRFETGILVCMLAIATKLIEIGGNIVVAGLSPLNHLNPTNIVSDCAVRARYLLLHATVQIGRCRHQNSSSKYDQHACSDRSFSVAPV